jgi:hypothetical protein
MFELWASLISNQEEWWRYALEFNVLVLARGFPIYYLSECSRGAVVCISTITCGYISDRHRTLN